MRKSDRKALAQQAGKASLLKAAGLGPSDRRASNFHQQANNIDQERLQAMLKASMCDYAEVERRLIAQLAAGLDTHTATLKTEAWLAAMQANPLDAMHAARRSLQHTPKGDALGQFYAEPGWRYVLMDNGEVLWNGPELPTAEQLQQVMQARSEVEMFSYDPSALMPKPGDLKEK